MNKPNRLTGNQINWNQVFYFSEIASAGSIKDAAQKLQLTPSTLSIHLAQLEKDLQVRLFHRQHRKLTLTPEGTRLFLHAKEMFEAGQRLIDVVSPIPLGSYPISVGLVPSPSLQAVNQILATYMEALGSVDIKLFHSNHEELDRGLSAARFDFGFSDRPSEHRDVVSREIIRAPIRFFVAEKWSKTPFAELLSKLPLLICSAEPGVRSYVEQALIDAEMAPSSVVTSDYPSTLLELCERGVGIGVFSEVPAGRAEVLTSLRGPRDAPKLLDKVFVHWSKDAENTAAVKLLVKMLDQRNPR